ncbi:DNA replication protein DnaC [Clostridium pasteurianum DSM 525 = ATCC 6013]|uniref:DNA replication protein DnaC n=1 Tax=Clostridium pasteurianum DSM 525 = ATCC 6013 TaxID=1262449 RepID=A0A0H3J9I4_CLOPA|nr:ATP-binding protein [Clostridium pasteurianum]AJA50007.1 DNA replication protein DnaC [Clostridium pasteurianum DSM 525 = ATCC 6013]AJA53995.1 DNA replication protein DnaC [Clostridium pasteurianum DSM 525 = ATCC 6013]AOZ77138.1 DNA replication protein DnaC [Clostridium pasteurianum DSM 525 = ATCC 6013]AOZ80935.1 DNA replication protein DnaC [Clostridium pasteurianum]ELP59283.1 DNA replication protein DnaC [Clostridium pasteurianum DSM 525 = ATCC 6013]
MIKGYKEEVTKMYSHIQEIEDTALKKRRLEISQKIPEVLDIERQIANLCINLSVISFKDVKNREQNLKNLKEKITDLRIKKSELLTANGYPIDYVSRHYLCNKCKDTGYIGSKKCTCYKQKLVKLYYKDSHLNLILKNNNFENFNINCYSSTRTGEEPRSPRKNMEEKIIPFVMDYIKNFSSSNTNLLFYGNSGTGKTFLSNCIAKDLLDRGFLVVYRTADDIIQELKKIKFENNSTLEDLLLNCDLLILDDLGTEQITDFSSTELFNLLNKKLLLNKKMLISSNYSLERLSRTYSERITSRLFGNFNLFKFYGEDIRVKINFLKQK